MLCGLPFFIPEALVFGYQKYERIRVYTIYKSLDRRYIEHIEIVLCGSPSQVMT